MYTSSKGGVWAVRLQLGKARLWLPVPLYVFGDLFDSLQDVCGLVLSLFHLPNYAAMAREVLSSMGARMDEPLVDVQTDGVSIYVKKIGGRA